MTEPRIVVVPLEGFNEQDEKAAEEEQARFRRMLEDFEYFATKSSCPFAPCGFVHQLLEKILDRIYAAAYAEIGKAQDPNPFICAATHIKKAKELSKEMTEQISCAMGDMHRGDPQDADMPQALSQLIRMLSRS
jgi:hypothetical protein